MSIRIGSLSMRSHRSSSLLSNIFQVDQPFLGGLFGPWLLIEILSWRHFVAMLHAAAVRKFSLKAAFQDFSPILLNSIKSTHLSNL